MDDFQLLSFDSQNWKNQYDEAIRTGQRDVARALRVAVFKNTISVVSVGRYVASNRKVAPFNDEEMQKGTTFYKSPFDVSDIGNRTGRADTRSAPTFKTTVSVINEDCLLVAEYLLFLGYKPAVLNMASHINPGGGVAKGSGAQEENLFRRTNLYRSLYRYAAYAESYGMKKAPEQYPLDKNFGGIYTPCATVFRGKESDGYPLLPSPFKMAFIAVPAINRPDIDDQGNLTDNMVEITKNKMRTIFRIAIMHGHDALVLGAMGCGAFRNPPAHIARLFHEVIEENEFKNKLKSIVFAVIDDYNAHRQHNPEGNYLPFAREFKDETCNADNWFRYLVETKYAAQIIQIRNAAHHLHESVNQSYGTSLPYTIHLDMVAKGTMQYAQLVCKDEADIIPIMFAAFFHDSIEDARQTYNDIKHTALAFMSENKATLAAELVFALSNDKGKTRAERAGEKYYNSICEVPYAPLIKLADRMANMKFSAQQVLQGKTWMKDVYAKELPHFLECIMSKHAANDPRFSLPKEMIEACKNS